MTTPESPVPRLQSLVDRMTHAAYEMDYDFRGGAADGTELTRSSKVCLGFYDDDESKQPLYDTRSVFFSAARPVEPARSRKPLRPHLFTVRFDAITQLPATPNALRQLIDPELLDGLPTGTLGDFNAQQALEYTVDASDYDGVDIRRNITYTLWSAETDQLHHVAETDDAHNFEKIPLPHENTEIVVVRRQSQEQIDDVTARIPYELVYDNMIDGIAGSVFHNELAAAREAEATLSILALVHSLKTGKSIPNILENPPQ